MHRSFKEWLISEMSHRAFLMDVDVAGEHGEPITIDAIDFRFEDYPKNSEEDRNLIRSLTTDQIHSPPFYGKFPGSYRFVTCDGDKLEIRLRPPMIGYIELPSKFYGDPNHSWWDYAAGLNGNIIVKKPLRMRTYE